MTDFGQARSADSEEIQDHQDQSALVKPSKEYVDDDDHVLTEVSKRNDVSDQGRSSESGLGNEVSAESVEKISQSSSQQDIQQDILNSDRNFEVPACEDGSVDILHRSDSDATVSADKLVSSVVARVSQELTVSAVPENPDRISLDSRDTSASDAITFVATPALTQTQLADEDDDDVVSPTLARAESAASEVVDASQQESERSSQAASVTSSCAASKNSSAPESITSSRPDSVTSHTSAPADGAQTAVSTSLVGSTASPELHDSAERCSTTSPIVSAMSSHADTTVRGIDAHTPDIDTAGPDKHHDEEDVPDVHEEERNSEEPHGAEQIVEIPNSFVTAELIAKPNHDEYGEAQAVTDSSLLQNGVLNGNADASDENHSLVRNTSEETGISINNSSDHLPSSGGDTQQSEDTVRAESSEVQSYDVNKHRDSDAEDEAPEHTDRELQPLAPQTSHTECVEGSQAQQKELEQVSDTGSTPGAINIEATSPSIYETGESGNDSVEVNATEKVEDESIKLYDEDVHESAAVPSSPATEEVPTLHVLSPTTPEAPPQVSDSPTKKPTPSIKKPSPQVRLTRTQVLQKEKKEKENEDSVANLSRRDLSLSRKSKDPDPDGRADDGKDADHPTSHKNQSPTKKPAKSAAHENGKKVPPGRVQVGMAPPPNLKNVKSRVGSLANASYKPGGGQVKIESRRIDVSRSGPRIQTKSDYKPGGGNIKIGHKKTEWKAESKVGSLSNANHKPGGGQIKLETQKLNFKDRATSKVGSKDNVDHKPSGGTTKVITHKTEYSGVGSRVGSLENSGHRPQGGDRRIYNDKQYLRQASSSRTRSSTRSNGSRSRTNSTAEDHTPITEPTTPTNGTANRRTSSTKPSPKEEIPAVTAGAAEEGAVGGDGASAGGPSEGGAGQTAEASPANNTPAIYTSHQRHVLPDNHPDDQHHHPQDSNGHQEQGPQDSNGHQDHGPQDINGHQDHGPQESNGHQDHSADAQGNNPSPSQPQQVPPTAEDLLVEETMQASPLVAVPADAAQPQPV